MNTIIQAEKTNIKRKKYKKIDMENVKKVVEAFKAIAEGRFKEI